MNKKAFGAALYLGIGVVGIVSGYTNPIWWQAIASGLAGFQCVYISMLIIISK